MHTNQASERVHIYNNDETNVSVEKMENFRIAEISDMKDDSFHSNHTIGIINMLQYLLCILRTKGFIPYLRYYEFLNLHLH